MKVFLTSEKNDQESGVRVRVISREFVILIMALNTKTTSHLLCVPYTEALQIVSNLMMISHSPQDQSVTVKLADQQGQKLFQAFAQKTFSEVSRHINNNKAFLLPVTHYQTIDQACLATTSLPLILNDPLPLHLKFLLTPPPPPQSLAQVPLVAGEGSGEKCPACSLRLVVQSPGDVTKFARHFYTHHSLPAEIIPMFLQTIFKSKKIEKHPVSQCPIDFCKQTMTQNEPLAKHVRRLHQFEVLIFFMMMNFENFNSSGLFTDLMKNCSNLSVKKFVTDFYKTVSDQKSLALVEEPKAPVVPFDKSKATDVMKKFFRGNVSDPGCKLFLKSKGEILKVAMYEKLLFFLFGSTKTVGECENIINFALKNLKKVFNEEDVEAGRETLKSSETFSGLKNVHALIRVFQENVRTLSIDPTDLSGGFVSQLVKLILKRSGGREEKLCFLSWRNSFYPTSQRLSLEELEMTEVVEGLTMFQCSSCDSTFNNLAGLVLHLQLQHGGQAGVKCAICDFTVKEISHPAEMSASQLLDVLMVHLLSRTHLNNNNSEEKRESEGSGCDVCNVKLSESEISAHLRTEEHKNNVVIVMEYLQFCKQRHLDPVNHQVFQDFIFFLRYIHSMSINLQRPIRVTMETVANIHSHFNNLLNMNESIDVTEEVIDKLSATEPAILFCFDCQESFVVAEDARDHLASCPGLRVRCVVCRAHCVSSHLESHSHHLRPLTTLDEAPEEKEVNTEPETRPQQVPEPEPANTQLKKVLLEKVSVSQYKATFNLPFDSKTIPEDSVEKVKFDVTVGDVLNSTKNKTIVDHCVEKRKLEDDPASTPYPLSWIKYKKLRMNLDLKIDKCELTEKVDEQKDAASNDMEEEEEDKCELKEKVDEQEEAVPATSNDMEEEEEEDLPYQLTRVKMEPVETEVTPENFKQLNFDIPLTDIALTPQWRDKLQPQIWFLKRKAEVFNRWKNDINFYFNYSSK